MASAQTDATVAPWTLREVLRCWLGMLGISVGAGAVSIATVYLAFLHGCPVSVGATVAADSQVLVMAAYAAGAFLYLRRVLQRHCTVREVWGPPAPGRYLLTAAGLGVSLAIAANLLWYQVHGPNADASLPTVMPHAWAMLPQFAVTVAAVPVVEELFYRGMAYRAMRVRWRVPAAVSASAAIYTVAHVDTLCVDPWQVASLYALGSFAALLAEGSGGLCTSYVLHASYNATALMAQWTVWSGKGA